MPKLPPNPIGGASAGQGYLATLVELFRRKGWRTKVSPSLGHRQADLVVSRGSLRYVVELKVSSEGRRDRVVPLLSQAVLQARACAQDSPEPAAPLAVIAAPNIPSSVGDGLRNFIKDVAPDCAVGMFDREGFRSFVGPGLEQLNAPPPSLARRQKRPAVESANLFSDLNQWMLKVLLAPFIPGDLLRAPRGEYRNASELAASAQVSVMSAFRFVRQLARAGFLDDDRGSLRLVRREELMRRWQAAHLRSIPELPLRWIIPTKKQRQLSAALQAYVIHPDIQKKAVPRACLGLFAAAEVLGFGFVQGVSPHFYLETLDQDVLSRLGLSPERAEIGPDVFVRVPSLRESIFRATVLREGIPVADVLQIWLDVSSHPARGEEQAEEIRRRILRPIFEAKS